VRDPDFFLGVRARRQERARRPSKGQEPAGDHFSHRDLSRRTGYPYVNVVTD
jgi:hypothetical protein